MRTRHSIIPLLILTTALVAILCSGLSARKCRPNGSGTHSNAFELSVNPLFQCI